MVFSSIPFLYYFLPAVMVVYFLLPKAVKNGWLLISSLVFYGWGEPRYVYLMIATILVCYCCGLGIGAAKKQSFRKLWLILSIVVSLGFLVVFKYLGFFAENFAALTGLSVPTLQIALPIGISFYTFQCLSYTVDVYRGTAQVQKNPINFGAYVALFPQLIAGPIVRYVDVQKQLCSRQHTWEDAAVGMRRFLVGLSKKILLADNFALVMQMYRDAVQPSVLFSWMYALAVMLYIYFDFSGYSDMAIGLGRIMGLSFMENFNYPYMSKSVTEFWRRWHMSLGSWFRDYVYIPMGGNRVKKWRWVINILTVWLLTGFWHGAAWNFVLWGLMFALLLLIEKWVPALQKLPAVLRHIYVLLLICISFVLFKATVVLPDGREVSSLLQAGEDLKAMFGFGGLPVVSAQTVYYLKSSAVLFLVGILGATPLVRDLARRVENTRLCSVLEPIVMLLLLIVCTAYLVDGSFSPFLYFNF